MAGYPPAYCEMQQSETPYFRCVRGTSIGEGFFMIVWERIFGSKLVCQVEPKQYIKRDDEEFVNSLYK